MRAVLALVALAAIGAVHAAAPSRCRPQALTRVLIKLKPSMLSCAIDAHVFGGKDFHCSSRCAKDMEESLRTSDAEVACIEGMFKGTVSLKSHPELDEDVLAFVKRGPELVDSCHLNSGRTLDQLTKDEQLHLLKMQADRTEALEALQALNRADAAALNATGAKTLAEAAKRAADAKKHSLVITQKLSEVSRIRANQLAAQAALGLARESAETTAQSVQGAIEMSKKEREAAAVAKKAKAAALQAAAMGCKGARSA
ncbi:hypothetical protein FNF31_02447 [Cafeteria roenbergensis]|uniref:Uncharacterized protein n=1 Tax=Cafeteria roenbergensis TaxID=33653 RepID=A0A5A8DK37_CAFRO|nr:hypothetical protein FNF31_02447 [Cafeteria roenbergensis]KAA0164977.1 hypothetical protein FNF28_03601 [Cafeteria roenbergensis]